MGINFAPLQEELAEIREKFIKVVNKILEASGGKPFYGKFFLNENNNYLIGLIRNLKANKNQIVFDLIEERVEDNKIVRNVKKKKINFELIRRIEIYETQDRKPIFIEEDKEEAVWTQ